MRPTSRRRRRSAVSTRSTPACAPAPRGPRSRRGSERAWRARAFRSTAPETCSWRSGQDAAKTRYADWEELLDYCRYSASPVGRFLMRLHGEDPALDPLGDALCAALQVLNHLQDLGDDRRALDRIYLPGDWMRADGAAEGDLDAASASPALRRTIDRCLDGCDGLLARSAPLSGRIRSRRLGAEVAVIHRLAMRLAARLRREDPLAGRVKHGSLDMAAAAASGLSRLAGAGSRP